MSKREVQAQSYAEELKSSFAPPMTFDPTGIPVGKKDDETLSAGGTKFETGAVRSSDKAGVQYHLISPIGLRRLAETHREGTDKYGLFNWERGMPIGDLLNHAIAHIYAFLSGVPSVDAKTGKVEDDLAHAAWNLFAAMHIEETMPHIQHELRFKIKDGDIPTDISQAHTPTLKGVAHIDGKDVLVTLCLKTGKWVTAQQ